MDPALQEIIANTNAPQEVEAIIKLKYPDQTPENVRIISRFGNIATCRLQQKDIAEVWADESIFSIKAPRYVSVDPEPTNESSPDLADSDLLQYQRRPTTPYTGKGVVVGVIDWGFDFTHPNFLRPDGSSRFLAIWDQSARPSIPTLNKFGYGKIHDQTAINQALTSAQPFAQLDYFPAQSDPFDSGSHAAHVTDIAAGNGTVGQSGLAPEADLVGVHLAAGNIGGLASLGDSVGILEAIDFIQSVAGDRPLVINMSVGKHGGDHLGISLVEQGMDAFLKTKPGRCIVQSTGNYYLSGTHTSGRLAPGEQETFTWKVTPYDKTANELEVWYSSRDNFLVELTPPTGAPSLKVSLGNKQDIIIENELVGRLYHRAFEPNTGDHHIDIFLYKNAPTGDWKVNLFGEDAVDGRYHAWIERDGSCQGCQSRFESADANSECTTGTICNGLYTIAVGAYNPYATEFKMTPFSSSGPTRDGRQKPNLLAPGWQIQAAKSAPMGTDRARDGLTYKSGTSMAAPHVTGAVALLFEAAEELLPIEKTRQLLFSSTKKIIASDLETAQRLGDGLLDTTTLLQPFQKNQITMLTDTTTHNHISEAVNTNENALEQWIEIPMDDADEEEMENTNRDIRFVKDRNSVIRTGAPNFSALGRKIPYATLVQVIETVRHNNRDYVLVVEALPNDFVGPAREIGWTLASNLRSNNATSLNWTDLKQALVRVANKEYDFWNIPRRLHERNSATFDRQRNYWGIISMRPSNAQLGSRLWQNGGTNASGRTVKGHAWSAVFISWVVQQAGAGDFFLYNAAHSCYVQWARWNREVGDTNNPFWAYDITAPEAAWPEPGDIICKNRGGRSLALASIRCGNFSHCDIIVEVDRTNLSMVTVGGNVSQRVARRVIRLNADGFVDPTRIWQIEGGGRGSQRDYYALIKVRTSRLIPNLLQLAGQAGNWLGRSLPFIEPVFNATDDELSASATIHATAAPVLESTVCGCQHKANEALYAEILFAADAENTFLAETSVTPTLNYQEAAHLFDQISIYPLENLVEYQTAFGTPIASQGSLLPEILPTDTILNRALGEGQLAFQHPIPADFSFTEHTVLNENGYFIQTAPQQWLQVADQTGQVAPNILIFRQFAETNGNNPHHINIAKAIRYNQRYAVRYGWQSRLPNILNLLQLPIAQATPTTFALAVAQYQKDKNFPSRQVIGILGPKTWRTMQVDLSQNTATTATPSPPNRVLQAVQGVAGNLNALQTNSVNAIAQQFTRHGDGDNRKLAYILATAWHESQLRPVRECFETSDANARACVSRYNRRYANEVNGHVYYGRGFVQLTWATNYQRMGRILGVDLYDHPDLALQSPVAAEILVYGMMHGSFTGRRLNQYFNTNSADYRNARRIVNGLDRADLIAGYARRIFARL